MGEIMEDYFFVIDSDNLGYVNTRLYGYGLDNDGLILESKKNYDRLSGIGAYVFVNVENDFVSLHQDYLGSFGIYVYANDDYFAVSNSFLKLVEHLRDKHERITFDKDYANYYLLQTLCSSLCTPTLVKEIKMIPSDVEVVIDKNAPQILFKDSGMKEHHVPLISKEALDILDSWFLKWVEIIRGLRKNSNNLIFDLSGGFDTRVVAAIWLNAKIDLTKVRVSSNTAERRNEDLIIAGKIADRFGFELNKTLEYNFIPISYDNSVARCMYAKSGFEKQATLRKTIPVEPMFRICGHGGELIKGNTNPIFSLNRDDYKKSLSRAGYKFNPTFFKSCEVLVDDEFEILSRKYDEDYLYENFASLLYRYGRARHHFGKNIVESLLFNEMDITPLSDPILQKIDKSGVGDKKILIALIFKRYCPELLDIEFEGGREISSDTLEVADEINRISPFEMPEYDFIEGPEIEEVRPAKKISFTSNLDKFKRVFDSKEFENDFSKYFPSEIYYKIKLGLYPNHRVNIRDIISAVQIMNVVQDVNMANDFVKPNFMDWMNKYSISDSDNSLKTYSSYLLDKFNRIRVDIKNLGGEDSSVVVLESSDDELRSNHPKWTRGYSRKELVLYSSKSSLDLKLKVIKDGSLRIKLRSINYKDKNGNPVPIYIDYTKFEIDGKNIFNDNKLISLRNPFSYKMDVKDSQIVNIHIEWLPFSEDSDYSNNELETLKQENAELKRQLDELKNANNDDCMPVY